MLLTIYIIVAVIVALGTAYYEVRASKNRYVDTVDSGLKILLLGGLWPMVLLFGIVAVIVGTTGWVIGKGCHALIRGIEALVKEFAK